MLMSFKGFYTGSKSSDYDFNGKKGSTLHLFFLDEGNQQFKVTVPSEAYEAVKGLEVRCDYVCQVEYKVFTSGPKFYFKSIKKA